MFSESDPYVVVTVSRFVDTTAAPGEVKRAKKAAQAAAQKFTTATIDDEPNPEWDVTHRSEAELNQPACAA